MQPWVASDFGGPLASSERLLFEGCATLPVITVYTLTPVTVTHVATIVTTLGRIPRTGLCLGTLVGLRVASVTTLLITFGLMLFIINHLASSSLVYPLWVAATHDLSFSPPCHRAYLLILSPTCCLFASPAFLRVVIFNLELQIV